MPIFIAYLGRIMVQNGTFRMSDLRFRISDPRFRTPEIMEIPWFSSVFHHFMTWYILGSVEEKWWHPSFLYFYLFLFSGWNTHVRHILAHFGPRLSHNYGMMIIPYTHATLSVSWCNYYCKYVYQNMAIFWPILRPWKSAILPIFTCCQFWIWFCLCFDRHSWQMKKRHKNMPFSLRIGILLVSEMMPFWTMFSKCKN